jgi:RNA polymerase sigma factor (sigma-70 family)
MTIDWRAILAEHGSKVWQTAYRLLNHRDDAQDCYQDTLLAALEFSRRQEIQDWGALLASLAARRAIDRLRQRIRQRGRTTGLENVPEPVTNANSPVEIAADADWLDHVRQCMTELSQKQAEVFWLYCVEGLSHQQVASQLEISQQESRVLLHRARLQLGAKLGLPLPTRGDNDEP